MKVESDGEPAARPKKGAAPTKVESDGEDAKVARSPISRKPRAAAKKAPTYNLSDSESNGDDMLFDVGKMVKGIDNTSTDQSSNTRPLFSSGSMPRPGSSAGLPKKSTATTRQILDLDGDDTDYSKLAPPPAAKRGASITVRSKVLPDDETDNDDVFGPRAPSPPKASKPSRAPKAIGAKVVAIKPTTKAKASGPIAAKKTTHNLLPETRPMSPAAKAYAAKRARNNTKNDSDDFDVVEKVAHEIMDDGSVLADSDSDDGDLIVRRPARKAAVQAVVKTKKSWRLDSDDDEDEDEIDDDEQAEDEEESESFEEDD